jgi:hypothetical protein
MKRETERQQLDLEPLNRTLDEMERILGVVKELPALREKLFAEMVKEPKLELMRQLTNILWTKSSEEIAELILAELTGREILNRASSYGLTMSENHKGDL